MKISSPFARDKENEVAGIGLASEQGAYTAAVVEKNNDSASLSFCRVQSSGDDAARNRLLSEVGEKFAGYRCVSVLATDDCRLTMLETPRVSDDAGRDEALRLKMQDMAGFDLVDAAFENFPCPSVAGTSSHYFTVATEEAKLESVAEHARIAKLDLAAIDIAELALRNVVALHDHSEAGVAVLTLTDDGCRLCLYRNDQLYIARKLKLNVGGLVLVESNVAGDDFALVPNESIAEGAGSDAEFDGLSEQINRSFSYYLSNLKQPPVNTLLVASASAAVQGDKLTGLLKRLDKKISPDVKLFDFSTGFNRLSSFESKYREAVSGSETASVSLLVAIGAALRGMESQA